MKLFQHVTDEDECLESYKILGLTISERGTVLYRRHPWSNKPLKKVYKRFIGRIVYKARYYNLNGPCKKEISILSIPIFRTIRLNGYKSLFIFGIKVYSTPLKFLNDFKTECLSKVDRKYDDIYIILQHVGDAFRMFTIINGIVRNNKSKSPLIMVFSKSFVDLIKMMSIDIPYIYIDSTKPFKKRMETQFSTDVFRFAGFRFFLIWNLWCMTARFNPIARSFPSDKHDLYIKAAAYNVTYNNKSMGRIKVLPEAEKSMLEKSRMAGLNLENYVFVAPEAFAYQMYNESFWENIIKILQSAGYDVFVNTVAGKPAMDKNSYTNDKTRVLNLDEVSNVKSFYLSIAEAYALACRSQIIISQRSGLCELLIQTEVPMCVIYSGKDRNNVEKFRITNTLLNSPFANADKINEINVVDMPLSDSIRTISEMLNIKT